MVVEMKKYHICLPLKAGKYVAALDPEAAVRACFPHHDLNVVSTGKGWVRFKSDQGFCCEWPHDGDTSKVVKTIDVEETGTILVDIPPNT